MIDVDHQTGDRAYGIPDDNPLVDEEGRDEQYAWGFRNPWRFSFDVGAEDPRLFVADVGQNVYEEVSLVEKGGNYGWNVREGAHCFRAEDCPRENPGGRPLRDPIVEYPHERDGETVGLAVVGGFFYRGDAVPALRNTYVFADWSGSLGAPQGSLFHARPPSDRDGDWSMEELAVEGREDGEIGRYVLGVGRDSDGELYVCTSGTATVSGSSGAVHRLAPLQEDDGTEATTGDRTPDDAPERSRETPGAGILGALLGVGGGLAALRWWEDRT